MRIVEPSYQILTELDGAAMLKRIEAAGRTCYKSEDKITEDSAEAFVRMVLKRGHESVIEHEWLSVRFVCDRGVSHEIVRHRLASYSQESTRYCDYGGDGIQVIEPFGLTTEQASVWRDHMIDCGSRYQILRELGAKPESARSVLPNSLKTEIVMTANVREWRHFFKMRAAKPAHPQMRQLACPLLAELRERVPVLFDDVGDPGVAP